MVKIKLGEVEYNLTFNMGFLKRLFSDYGIDALKIDWAKINTSFAEMSSFTQGLFCAGVNNTLRQQRKEVISKDEIELIAEQMHLNDMTYLISAFTNWMVTPQETLNGTEKEEGSKAQTFHVE